MFIYNNFVLQDTLKKNMKVIFVLFYLLAFNTRVKCFLHKTPANSERSRDIAVST